MSFPRSQLFVSGGRSIGTSASVLPKNIQGWFPFGLTGLISLLSKGLSRVLSSSTISKASILWHSAQQLGFIKWPWEHRGKEMNSFGWDQKGFMETDIGAILPSVPWTCFVLPGMSFISSHHLPFVSNFSPSSRINKDPIWSPSLTSTLCPVQISFKVHDIEMMLLSSSPIKSPCCAADFCPSTSSCFPRSLSHQLWSSVAR